MSSVNEILQKAREHEYIILVKFNRQSSIIQRVMKILIFEKNIYLSTMSPPTLYIYIYIYIYMFVFFRCRLCAIWSFGQRAARSAALAACKCQKWCLTSFWTVLLHFSTIYWSFILFFYHITILFSHLNRFDEKSSKTRKIMIFWP